MNRVLRVLCLVVLVATACAKIALLVGPSPPLLEQTHPAVGLSMRTLLAIVAGLELGVAFAGLRFGDRVLGIGTSCLGAAFLGYHSLQGVFGWDEPCACLGAMVRWNASLASQEGTIATFLALLLLVAGACLLGRLGETTQSEPSRPLAVVSAVIAWVISCGILIVLVGDSLGGDEGMETAKALLLHSDGTLNGMWNDQSPLYTWFISGVWSVTGPSLQSARLATLAITCLLPMSAAFVLPGRLAWAAVFIGPVLLLHRESTYLMASIMLELPALALGASSLIPVARFGAGIRPVIAASAIAGLALAFKPTAVFGILPMMFLLPMSRWPLFGSLSCLIGASVAIGSGADLWTMLMSHGHRSQEADLNVLRLAPVLTSSSGFAILLILGLLAAMILRRSNHSVALVCIASISIAILALHRPYWGYYSVHIITPLAIAMGIGLVEFLRSPRIEIPWKFAGFWLVATTVIIRGQELYREGNLLLYTPLTAKMVREQMGELPPRRVLTEDATLTMTFGGPPVPEFAIVPSKRKWVGDLAAPSVARAILDHHPEIVCLYPDTLSNRCVQHALLGYTKATGLGRLNIYVSTNLPPISFPNQIKDFGL